MSELVKKDAARWDLDRMFREAGLPTPFTNTRISFGDLDLQTERNGHFLDIEGKRSWLGLDTLIDEDGHVLCFVGEEVYQELPTGQRLTMNARVRDGHTVLVVYGDPEAGEVRAIQHYPGEKVAADTAGLWRFINAWFRWADKTPPPAPRLSGFTFRQEEEDAA